MCFCVDRAYVFTELHSTTSQVHMLISLAACRLPLTLRGPAVAVRTRDKKDKRERGKQRTTVTKTGKRKGRMKWCWSV